MDKELQERFGPLFKTSSRKALIRRIERRIERERELERRKKKYSCITQIAA